jgi:hypothetical protein
MKWCVGYHKCDVFYAKVYDMPNDYKMDVFVLAEDLIANEYHECGYFKEIELNAEEVDRAIIIDLQYRQYFFLSESIDEQVKLCKKMMKIGYELRLPEPAFEIVLSFI